MDQHPTSSHVAASHDLRHLLSQDHTRLDRLFQDLLNAFEADARTQVAQLWNEFDNDLRAHLQLEEEHLLPKFLEFNAPEALALMREHQSIRDRLLQLGVGVDLHLTRHGQVADFVRELRAHAQREDALMYRWSTQHVRDPELNKSVAQRLLGRR
jgi:hemerythrin-like domain-containing protein